MKTKQVQFFTLITALTLLLTSCAPREFYIDVGQLPDDVWAVVMVRIDPADEDYAENEMFLTKPQENGEDLLIPLKGTMIDLYDEDGWRCYDLHGDHSVPSSLPHNGIYLTNYIEDAGFNELARRFGAIRIAAINSDGDILKITAQVFLQDLDTYAVASGGTYDYAANTLDLTFDTQRTIFGGMTLWELSDLCILGAIAAGLLLFIMSLTRRFNFRAGRWERVVFVIFSLPPLAAAVTVVLNALPYFDPTGDQASFLPQRLLLAEFLWALAALLFFLRKAPEKDDPDTNERI